MYRLLYITFKHCHKCVLGSVNAGENDWGMSTKIQKDELIEGSQAKQTTDANKGRNTPLSHINTNMEKNHLTGEKLEDTTDVKGDDLSKRYVINYSLIKFCDGLICLLQRFCK